MAKPPKTRAGNLWTEARYWGFIRSGLRGISKRWPPRSQALKDSRRAYIGENPRQKYEYQCAGCLHWFPAKLVQVDHVIPCGELRAYSDLPQFVERLFCESDNLRVLCHACHALRRLERLAE